MDFTFQPNISIHALLAESDKGTYSSFRQNNRISIHALLAESDSYLDTLVTTHTHFYPRSPCGERHVPQPWVVVKSHISIHALLAESDQEKNNGHETTPNISIHALLAESDKSSIEEVSKYVVISIHALLAESDLKTPCVRLSIDVFLSTLSLRRATHAPNQRLYRCNISIHALLAESDSPHSINCMTHTQFLSTLSLRRATQDGAGGQPVLVHFYPRSPCGERPSFLCFCCMNARISIHALLAESDSKSAQNSGALLRI